MKKLKYLWIFRITVTGVFLIFANSCSKKDSIQIPEITTYRVINITETTAVCEGEITNNGGAKILARGVCWSKGPTPTINNYLTTDNGEILNISSLITLLSANTKYYVRAYATNSAGTGYGDIISFSTNKIVTTDYDGNTYDTIRIGKQLWMAQNLKVTHYRNGDPIDSVANEWEWMDCVSGAYCDYDNKFSNGEIYGKIYNLYTVVDSRELCPIGWHVPTFDEWDTLRASLLDNAQNVGGKLKEVGTNHWHSPNAGATNESGFTALPGGVRLRPGFYFQGSYGCWWKSTDFNGRPNAFLLLSDSVAAYGYGLSKEDGCSVRCLKD